MTTLALVLSWLALTLLSLLLLLVLLPVSLAALFLPPWPSSVRFWECGNVGMWCGTSCTCRLHYCAVVVGLHQPGIG